MRRIYRFVIGCFFLLPLSAFAGPYLGVAYVDNIVGLNLEWAWSRTSVYLVPGYRFSQSTGGANNSVRWVGGVRHLMSDGTMEQSGFFLGLIGGDLGGSRHYRRSGIGGEIGYQHIEDFTRWTVSGAMVVLEHDPVRNLRNEPAVVFGLSVSLR